MTVLRIRDFTDPACPFAFSAEPQRRRLEWLYGDHLHFERRMVVLSCTPEENERKGMTPEKLSAGLKGLQRKYGMPIDARRRERLPVTIDACRAVVAARVHGAPGDDAGVLRHLRVRGMAGELIDEPAVIDSAVADAGLDPEQVRGWCGDERTRAALAEDMDAARHPLPAALHLDGKLASWGEDDGRRYTCPSYVFVREDGGREIAAPGFQPVEVYEVIVANLAAELPRRENPGSVDEILAWAGEPLATAEVAAVCEIDADEAREQLARVATSEPVGPDGYWTLPELSVRRMAA